MTYIKTSYLLFLIYFFLAVGLNSCGLDDNAGRVDDLQKRIESLEARISEINGNAIASDILYRDNILISDFTPSSDGYVLTLSNGQELKVVFGDRMEGFAPVLGVDRNGNWILSVDGGKTFSVIDKSHGPDSHDGISPVIGVDSDGFWTISRNGGEDSEWIRDASGNPISAVDGKMASDLYSYFFFSKVSYNSESNSLDFRLVTGETFSIPFEEPFGIDIKFYDHFAYVFSGRDTEFDLDVRGISGAVWQDVPEGWRFRIEDDKLIVSAPPTDNPGDYKVRLLAFSEKGMAKTVEWTFRYDPTLVFRDDFDTDHLNMRYWNIMDRHVESNGAAWCYHAWGGDDVTYVRDGVLTMLGIIDPASPTGYRQGAVHSDGKVMIDPPFRIDISARFTKMAQGIWFALWLTPKSGYADGEIDIVEKLNFGDRTYHTVHNRYTINTESQYLDQRNQKYVSVINVSGFNVYSVEVREDAVVFFVNGSEVHRYMNIPHSEEDEAYKALTEPILREYYLQNYPYMNQPFRIIMNIAMGGDWPGPLNDSQLPGQFDIDWVQVHSL